MKPNRSFVAVILLLVVALLAWGCIPQNVKVKSISEMTPKEKATWMLSVYNKQFDDTMAMAQRTDLTEQQKEIVRKKKKILVEVKPYIKTYTTFVDAGGVPAQETEDKIIELLNDLVAQVGS